MPSLTRDEEDNQKSSEATKITINPDLPVKRDSVETLAGLSPRLTKKLRSSSADHTGSLQLFCFVVFCFVALRCVALRCVVLQYAVL